MQEGAENLSRPITSKEIESLIKNFPKMKSPGWFLLNTQEYQFSNFQNIEEEGTYSLRPAKDIKEK